MPKACKSVSMFWISKKKNKEKDSAKNLKKAVQAEIDNDKELKSSQFKNSKMQEDVISYLNLVDDSMDVLDKYGYDTAKYGEQWSKVYDKRTAQLKKTCRQIRSESGCRSPR